MVPMSPLSDFDRKYGSLYLKGIFTDSEYLTGRNYFNLLSNCRDWLIYFGAPEEEILPYRKQLGEIATSRHFWVKTKDVFRGIANSCRALFERVC
jgi:hypothetical protein